MAKNSPDAVKGQFAEHPQAENLLVGFFQRVQTLVHRKSGVFIHQKLRDVRAVGGFCFGIFQRGGVLCAAWVVVRFLMNDRSKVMIQSTDDLRTFYPDIMVLSSIPDMRYSEKKNGYYYSSYYEDASLRKKGGKDSGRSQGA